MYAIKINRFFFSPDISSRIIKKKKKNLLRSIFKEETVLFFFFWVNIVQLPICDLFITFSVFHGSYRERQWIMRFSWIDWEPSLALDHASQIISGNVSAPLDKGNQSKHISVTHVSEIKLICSKYKKTHKSTQSVSVLHTLPPEIYS